jgi:uncharacterized protein with beta-barrel porin domain
MFGNVDRRRKPAAGIHSLTTGAAVLRSAAISALAAAAALASAPARAQFVCTTTGIDNSCTNTGTQVAPFSAGDTNVGGTVTVTNTSTGTVTAGGTTANSATAGVNVNNTNAGTIAISLQAFANGGGNASGNNSGTINGAGTGFLLSYAAALRVSTQYGGNATAINSGSLTTSGIVVFTQNRTPGPNGDATGTNTASGAVATLFLVEAGAQSLGTGGNATGTNAGSVGQYFQVDALTGGNATGTNSGTVGQFFQVDTLAGGNAVGTNSGGIAQYFNVTTTGGSGNVTGTNSGTVAGEFLVAAALAGNPLWGGNATGTNSGTVGLDFTVTSTGAGGNVSATSSGKIGTDFVVSTPVGNVTAANSGSVGGRFSITETTLGSANTVTAVNSGSVGTNFIVSNASVGVMTATNSGTVGGGFFVTAVSGGNVTAINSGSVGQAFRVILAGNAASSVTATNSGSVGSFIASTALATLPANVTASNSGTIGTAGVVSQGFQIEANPGGNATGTNSGTVNGSVQVTNGNILGGGSSSFTNSGTINNPTGTAITFSVGTGTLNANNTLTLLQGSSVAGNIVLGAGGNNVVNVDASGPIAGNIVGGGAGNTLNFAVGPGTFIYGSAFGFTGFDQVNLSSGTVILNGTNSATNVAVTGGNLQVGDAADTAAKLTGNVNVTGATLSGHGTVVGNVTIGNGATLAPGGSVGTLSIQGNLVMTTAMSYLIDVSSTGASSTAVSGTAALGGMVQVFSSNNSYRLNSPYTILTSAGLGGTQFNAMAPMAGITEALSYTANNVQLTLTSALGQLTGLNANQRAVATTLDAAFNSGGSTGPLGGIFNGNIPFNLTQASGELGTGSQQTTFDAMNQFMGVMTDPFIAGRGDGIGSGAGTPSFAEENAGASAYAGNGKARSQSERDAYGMITKAPPLADSFTQRWSVWAAGFGGSQTTDGNAAVGSNAATSRIAGTAVGADYRFSPFTIAGFALAGGGTSFSLANALGAGHSDLFQAGAYVRHVVGPAYLSAALAYGWQDVTTDRTVTIAGVDRLHAEFNANAFSGRVEGGYRFATPWMGVTPYAAGQFTTFDLPAYAESALAGSNAFALAYNAKSVTDTRSELGIRTDKSFALPNGILTLRSRFAWAHDFDPDRSIAATFQALPGASFVVNGAAQAKDSALTTVSAEMKWMNGWSAAATFEGEFSDVTRSYAGKGVVRYQW